MKSPVLVGYATSYGSTREVAEAISDTLGECGLVVDIQPARAVRALAGYGAVVLGAPLIMYHLHKDALGFLSRHRKELMQRPVAIFALGPVHDPHDEQEWQNSRDQLAKEIDKYPWLTLVALELFGGKFDPALLRFPLNKMAGKEPASDIRNWAAIHAWATGLVKMFETELS